MSAEFPSHDIAEKYNRFARGYDYFESVLGFLGLRTLRQSVVSQASGKVLEVAVGTGQNFHYYRSDCEITAVDVSSGMLKIARERAASLNLNVRMAIAYHPFFFC
jgi:ubiquinone/menaquinone biosynthesis C-methylase UbiE